MSKNDRGDDQVVAVSELGFAELQGIRGGYVMDTPDVTVGVWGGLILDTLDETMQVLIRDLMVVC